MSDEEIPPVRLTTDEEMARAGWAAWSRDARGLLCTSHSPFEDEDTWKDYVIEETRRGYRVFYPDGPLKWREARDGDLCRTTRTI